MGRVGEGGGRGGRGWVVNRGVRLGVFCLIFGGIEGEGWLCIYTLEAHKGCNKSWKRTPSLARYGNYNEPLNRLSTVDRSGFTLYSSQSRLDYYLVSGKGFWSQTAIEVHCSIDHKLWTQQASIHLKEARAGH